MLNLLAWSLPWLRCLINFNLSGFELTRKLDLQFSKWLEKLYQMVRIGGRADQSLYHGRHRRHGHHPGVDSLVLPEYRRDAPLLSVPGRSRGKPRYSEQMESGVFCSFCSSGTQGNSTLFQIDAKFYIFIDVPEAHMLQNHYRNSVFQQNLTHKFVWGA